MGGGAAANTKPVPSPAAATPASARARAPHATAEGADGAIAMDVCVAGGEGRAVSSTLLVGARARAPAWALSRPRTTSVTCWGRNECRRSALPSPPPT